MSQIKKIIHVGGYGITPSDIGSIVRNFPTWCSEGSSIADLSSIKKPTKYLWDSKRKKSGCNPALHERQISLECNIKTVVID